MNIFKKFGSFASNSWKDFTEYNEQQPLNETEPSEMKLTNENSFELMKRDDAEVARKKAIQGFFRKRFSKKKLLVDDPRSPSLEFQRTPIQLCKTYDQNDSGILSPFNVQDMLATIDSAIDTPKKVDASDLNIENDESENVPEEKDFIANISDWEDFKFNEKVLTESLIVEVSTLDIQSDLTQQSICEVINDIQQNVAQEENVAENMQQCLLEEEQIANNNCKIVGCIVKDDVETVNLNTDKTKLETETMVVTSTPKKLIPNSKFIKDEKKALRTPLLSIRNSPMVNSPVIQKNASTNKQKGPEKQKKKKLNSAISRQLPKAPSTPLTPLFKPTNQLVSHYDKENF